MIAAPPLVSSTFVDLLRARAAAHPRRVVFPETADLRVRTAIETLSRERIVEPIAILDPAAPDTHAAVRALGVETADPIDGEMLRRTVDTLLTARRKKGLT